MLEKVENKRVLPILLKIVIIIYSGLCIFSLVVGLYFIINNKNIDYLSLGLSEQIINSVNKFISLTNGQYNQLVIIAGIMTFVVGIFQGATALSLLKGHKKFHYGFALGFTLFSLLSCLSKMIMAVTLFGIIKVFVYGFIIFVLIQKNVRNLFVK